MTGTERREEVAGSPGGAVGVGRLGMLADSLMAPGGQVVFGVQTAIDGFIRAVLRHATVAGCDLFATPSVIPQLRSQVAAMISAPTGPETRVWPVPALADRLTAAPPLALHDANAEVWRLHYLRDRIAPGSYPITVCHHTVSYSTWRVQVLLPMLLAGYRPYDAVICTSSTARTAIAALLKQMQAAMTEEHGVRATFHGRLEVIPLGVNTTVFKPRERAEARAQLGLPSNKIILLGLGRFSAADKMDLCPLLQAFHRLRRSSGRDLLLVLAGSDPAGYLATVASLAADLGVREHVRLVTNVSPLAPPLLYAAADLFVSVSDNVQEMCGQTPLEAMASGLPVVVSDWDGYRDSVIHGETGFRVPTFWSRCDPDISDLSPLAPVPEDHLLLAQSVAVDTEKLHDYLKLLVEDPALRRRMGEAARRHAVAEYEWSVIIRRYEALWEDLSAEARACETAPERRSLGFARADYIGAFGHFATRLLDPATPLRLTDLGEQAARGKEPLRLFQPIAPLFSRDGLQHALVALRVAGRLRRTLTVSTLLAALQARHGLTEPVAWRHVMWLLKYGLIAVAAD